MFFESLSARAVWPGTQPWKMEPLLILVLRKVNPFTCFFQAFSLEFAQEAELPLIPK